VIYFIRKPDGPIKIGTTIRLSERLQQLALEYGEGLEVLGVAEGSFEVERGLHSRFRHLRLVGEWFEPGDDLIGFIVSDGRPWDGSDEKPVVKMCLRRSEHAKLKIVAACQGREISEILSEITRNPIDKLWKQAVKEQGEQAEAEGQG
jgi:hypothetical protein